jgi:RES domain-containing protein
MLKVDEFYPLLCAAKKVSGMYFRAITADRALKRSVLSIQGSFITGGRFNIRNKFGALYVSEHWETAIKESINTGKRIGFNEFVPKTLVAIKVDSLKVLDLDDATVREHLGIRCKDVQIDWMNENRKDRVALTQSIGELGREAGFDAVAMKSQLDPKTTNLAIFIDKVPESQITVLHYEKLPG